MIPSYGSRLAPKVRSVSTFAYMGGSCFTYAHGILIFGTECGHILKGSYPANKPKEFDNWSSEAWKLIQDAPYRNDVKKEIEISARKEGISVITPATIFSNSIDPCKYYPIAAEILLESHLNWVSALMFSPFSRSLFLSASTDGSMKLFSTLYSKPLLSISRNSKLVDACWSPVRPCVCAAATDDGRIEFFDWTVVYVFATF